MRREIRDDFQRVYERFDAFDARLASLEASRAEGKGWVKAAWAFGGVAISTLGWVLGKVWPALLLFLVSCAGPMPSWRAVAPVDVTVDAALPDCAGAFAVAIGDFWSQHTDRMVLRVVDLGGRRQPMFGEILVVAADRPGDVVATTFRKVTRDGQITAARVLIEPDFCWPDIAAHELGHALGLPDTSARGTIMCRHEECSGWALSADEIEHVTFWR
jgi:hypothetical protein